MAYAEKTKVTVEKSQGEIRKVLTRYGASSFGFMEEENQASVGFKANERVVRFNLPYPHRNDYRDRVAGNNKVVSGSKDWDQEVMRRWRALALCIKAKLEAVETGITDFETEFLGHIVVPGDGRTFAQMVKPQLAEAYETGKPPMLMLTDGGKR